MEKVVNGVFQAARVSPVVLGGEDDDGGRRTDEFTPGYDGGVFIILGGFDCGCDGGFGDGVVGDGDGGVEGEVGVCVDGAGDEPLGQAEGVGVGAQTTE